MGIQLTEPRTRPDGLDHLGALWMELHAHHRDVASYPDLVDDLHASWQRRREFYRRLLDEGAAYIIALDDDRPVGYAMVALGAGPDDTFSSRGGIAEVLTLVVTAGHRGTGVGTELLHAAEAFAAAHGIDLVRIAVMAGNARAEEFYESQGYAIAEHLLYRRI